MPIDDLYVPKKTDSKGVLEPFKTWKMAKLAFIRDLRLVSKTLHFRLVNGMVYYGLSMSSEEFGGSIYLNFVLTSLVEIPANILVIDNCNR